MDDAATVTGPPNDPSPNISPDYVDVTPPAELGFLSPEDMDIEREDYRTYRTRALEEARQRYQEQTEFVSDAIQRLTQEFQGAGRRPSPADERLLQALQVQQNQIVQAHEILNDTVNQIISGARPEDVFSVLPARFERAPRANASSSSTAQIEAELRDNDPEDEYEELPRFEGEDVFDYRERKALYRRQQKQCARDVSSPSDSNRAHSGAGGSAEYIDPGSRQPPVTDQSISMFPTHGRNARGGPPHPPRAGWFRRMRSTGRPIPLPPISPPHVARQTPPHLHRPQPVRASNATAFAGAPQVPPQSAVRFAPISTAFTHAATPSQFAGNVLVGNRATPRFIDAFVEAGLERLATQIQRVLGRPLLNQASAPKAAAKPPLPTPYRGQNNHELFETWSNALIRYLRLSRYCGDEWDEDRLLHLGTALEGPAADWFREEVEHSHFVEGRLWTFTEAMCELYARFVRAGTAQRMAERYDSVRYSASRGGINTLYNELLRYANRMASPPDAYSIARRFLQEMPTDVSSVLEYIYMMSAESTPIADMLEAALHVEDINARQARHRTTEASTTSRPVARMLGSRRPSQPARSNRQEGASARPPAAQGPTSSPREARPGTDRDQTRENRRDFRRDPRTPARRTSDSKGKSTDKSGVKCFKCSGLGHYSTDPECPLFSKASVRMMTTAEDGGNELADALDASPATNQGQDERANPEDDQDVPAHHLDRIDEYEYDEGVEGSQYDPDGERYDDDDFDWYAADEKYEDANDDFERLTAMRIQADEAAEGSESYVSEQEAREFDELIRAVELPDDPDQTIRPPSAAEEEDEPPALEEEELPYPLPQPEEITHVSVRQLYYALPEEVFLGLLEIRLRMGARALREAQVEAAYFEREVQRAHRETRTSQLETTVLRQRLRSSTRRNAEAEQQLARTRDELTTANAANAILPHYLEDAPPVYASPAPASVPLAPEEPRRRPTPPGDSLYNDAPQFSRTRTPSPASEGSVHENQAGPSTLRERPVVDTTAGLTITSRIPRITSAGSSRTATIARSTGPNARADVLSRYRAASQNHRLAAITPTDRAYRATVHPASSATQRPRSSGQCMVIEARISGLSARVLLDSGSTLNCISPDFVQAAGIRPFELSTPITLQLGCVGSRSKANFGVRAPIQIGPSIHNVYLDVVNIDHYDMILGVPFMHDTRAIMNWATYSVTLGSTVISALRGEGASLSHNAHRNHRDEDPRPRNALNSVRETR